MMGRNLNVIHTIEIGRSVMVRSKAALHIREDCHLFVPVAQFPTWFYRPIHGRMVIYSRSGALV